MRGDRKSAADALFRQPPHKAAILKRKWRIEDDRQASARLQQMALVAEQVMFAHEQPVPGGAVEQIRAIGVEAAFGQGLRDM